MQQNEKALTVNFNDFYTNYYRRTFLFAKSYVHDPWIAEDIASEAIVSLWETMKRHEIQHLITFLFSIVRHKSIDYLRHELTRQEVLAQLSEVGQREVDTRITTLEAFNPEKIYLEEIKAIVHSTLDTLPERTRDIFLMSRFQNLTKEEIAAALGITTKGVDYHIANALKSLRISLRDYLPIFYFMLFQ